MIYKYSKTTYYGCPACLNCKVQHWSTIKRWIQKTMPRWCCSVIISLFNSVHYLKHLNCMVFNGKKSGGTSVQGIIPSSFGKTDMGKIPRLQNKRELCSCLVRCGEDACVVVAQCFRVLSHFFAPVSLSPTGKVLKSNNKGSTAIL